MNRITSIVFDLDGTLYQSTELADEIQRRAAEAVALQMGTDSHSAREQLGKVKAEITARTGCEATLSAACESLGCDIRSLHEYLAANIAPEQHIGPDPVVIETVRELGDTYNLCIYTNNNRHLTGRILTATGLAGLFQEIFTVEDFWRAKPDRLALAKVYAAIGAEPIECLFAGDRYDVDLRLPEEHGSLVFPVRNVEELLRMKAWLKKGE